MDFDDYSKHAIHFFSRHVPSLLNDALQGFPEESRLMDFGCGDGQIIFALKNKGLLNNESKVTGVDLSEQRIARFTENTGYEGIVASGEKIARIDPASVDFAISTMVIEHMPDDHEYLKEIMRTLKPGGRLFVTTVFKKKGSWYFRRNQDGETVLDSTHVREYASAEEFLEVLQDSGFEVDTHETCRLRPPLAHPIVRILNRVFRFKNVNQFFLHPKRAWLERLTIPIPRYREIQVLARKPRGF